MNDHALYQVQAALAALLQTGFAANVETVAHDRDLQTDPFQANELPGVLVRCTGCESYPSNYQSQQEHNAAFFLDIVTGETVALAIGRRASQIAAEAHRIIRTDMTLGGKTQPIETVGLGVVEQQGADLGTVSLPLIIKFVTPRDDYTTIIIN